MENKNWQEVLIDHSLRKSSAHRAYLQGRKDGLRDLSTLLHLGHGQNSEHGLANLLPLETKPVLAGRRINGGLDSSRQPLFDTDQLNQFAQGSVTACFGEDYRIFENRRLSRIPNGDFLVMSRVMEMNGTPFDLSTPASIQVEYDVPADAWYLNQNDFHRLPVSILMEIALQPCGFLTASLRTQLLYPERDLYFRNLDGSSRLLYEPDLAGEIITADARLHSSVVSGGIIIQKFSFELTQAGRKFFEGESVFGFFSGETMSRQAGLDGGKIKQPAIRSGLGIGPERSFHSFKSAGSGKRPFFSLPTGQMRLLDEIHIAPNGGRENLGLIHGTKKVNPQEWFFGCHFHQDPVMPGSLGVESVFEAMKAFSLDQHLGDSFIFPRFGIKTDEEMRWKYRGQITPENRGMEIEVQITGVERQADMLVLRADASLWVDQVRIYEIENIGLVIKEGRDDEQYN